MIILGFKKGFLSSKPVPKHVEKFVPKTQQKDDIVSITANPQIKDSRIIPEVQEAMKMNQTLLDKKNQWLTPELLKKITENPSLAKLFTNPEYLQAITMMQKNPKEVMEKYKNNKEFTTLLTEFSGMMGQHFIEVSKNEAKDKSNQSQSQNSQIIVDKEVEVSIRY